MENLTTTEEVQEVQQDSLKRILHSDNSNIIETVSVENVQVGEINKFDIIPDYFSECTICMPVIINQNGLYQCIENWRMVENAISSNQEFIECRVVTPANPSER